MSNNQSRDAFFDDKDRHTFEMQKTETPLAYNAFVMFRDLPPIERKRKTIAQALNKSESLISRWANRFYWDERAADWDTFTERFDLYERFVRLKAIREQMGNAAKLTNQMGLAILTAHAKRIKDIQDQGENLFDHYTMAQGLSFVNAASQLEVAMSKIPTPESVNVTNNTRSMIQSYDEADMQKLRKRAEEIEKTLTDPSTVAGHFSNQEDND